MKRAAAALALALLVPSCTQRDSVAALPAPGRETTMPPLAQAERIRVATAIWSADRFLALAPRWFVLAKGASPIAVMRGVDQALGNDAHRIAEDGPPGDVALHAWRIDREHGLVAAVTIERDAAPLAAYFPIRIDRRWRAGRRR